MNTQKKDMLNKELSLQQQGTSNTQDRRESKYEKHDVEGTPFIVIEEPEGDYESKFHVVLGKYKVSEWSELRYAKLDAETITWDRILQVVGILIQTDREMEREKINNIEVKE